MGLTGCVTQIVHLALSARRMANSTKERPNVLRTSALPLAASVAVPDPAVAADPAHLHQSMKGKTNGHHHHHRNRRRGADVSPADWKREL